MPLCVDLNQTIHNFDAIMIFSIQWKQHTKMQNEFFNWKNYLTYDIQIFNNSSLKTENETNEILP